MLDPFYPEYLNLNSLDSYLVSCQALAKKRLASFNSLEEVSWAIDDLNCYPRLDNLTKPKDIYIVNEKFIAISHIINAAEALVSGKVLIEHTCAGEATRLGLGSKYLINPQRDFIRPEWNHIYNNGLNFAVQPKKLKSLSLGQRHMLQLAWDLWQLAKEMGRDPIHVLSQQTMIVAMNQVNAKAILADFYKANFYGFNPKRVLFLIQESFPGLVMNANHWIINYNSPFRLHNHGQMLMQMTMDKQVFCLDSKEFLYLSWQEFAKILAKMVSKISFNIEDLDYLNQSLDLSALAVVLKFASQGIRMVMEVVANNPNAPIKGGGCWFDPILGRDVMIESFQLKGITNQHIYFLNKNINYYPNPLDSYEILRKKGLSMPLTIKNGGLYFQPVQGDLSFLLPTLFLRQSKIKPIRAWKSIIDTPIALEVMAQQDSRPGFLPWASSLTGLQF